MDLLRLTTAGSVDDGKSTLIGRLLYDAKAIFEDQLDAVAQASKSRGKGDLDLALLTDGLRAEREQGITIDVAYRYFATPTRKFIIADTPGHVQYTRNMVTGASTADLAIVLVDARRGVLTQSKRHGFIASLLGIEHLVVCVNKMDLVDYDETVFAAIEDAYTDFSAKLDIQDIVFIPVSALHGDNVVDRSDQMPWYSGATLLHYLDHVNVAADQNLVDFRFPVQTVIRPDQHFRGYAGTVASGVVRPGEPVVTLPAGTTSHIKDVVTFDGALDEARAGQAVVLTLEDDIDVGRGAMLARPGNLPQVASELEAMVCWMGEEPLDPSRRYLLQHTTREVQALVDEVVYRVDVDTLHRETVATLALNDIGRVRLAVAQPLFFDPYTRNAETGAFILVDPFSNATVAAGMIRGAARTLEEVAQPAREEERTSPHVVWEEPGVPRAAREARNGHQAAIVWFTGLSGSGKTTVAQALEQRLFAAGVQTAHLDGDRLRHGLSSDLGFLPSDREENLRRVGEVSRLLFESGLVVLCSFVSPYRASRESIRALFPEKRFIEVFVDVSLEVAKERDPKGLYEKAEKGEIESFTGVSAPYEAPEAPALVLQTDKESVEESVKKVWAVLVDAGIIPAQPA